jgi:hypothetical protein
MSRLFESQVVIWGLKSQHHSHRFIHANFFKSLKYQGVDVLWLDDLPDQQSKIKDGATIIGVDVASTYLPISTRYRYVAHNLEHVKKFAEFENVNPHHVLRLQTFTKSATGSSDPEGSIAKYDESNRTLFQPWGTPIPESEWTRPESNRIHFKTENWVGSIWNDALGQGNMDQIAAYKIALANYGFKFKRYGMNRITRRGLSERTATRLVRISPIGAAIHGGWQVQNQLYACRLFKAVSAGVAPVTNQNAQPIFQDTAISDPDMMRLVEASYKENKTSKIERAYAAQKYLKLYTYEKAFERMDRAYSDEWN